MENKQHMKKLIVLATLVNETTIYGWFIYSIFEVFLSFYFILFLLGFLFLFSFFKIKYCISLNTSFSLHVMLSHMHCLTNLYLFVNSNKLLRIIYK